MLERFYLFQNVLITLHFLTLCASVCNEKCSILLMHRVTMKFNCVQSLARKPFNLLVKCTVKYVVSFCFITRQLPLITVTTICYGNLLKRPTEAFCLHECNFITQRPPTCFGHTSGRLQGGKNKNKNIFIVCRDHSAVKLIQFWLFFCYIAKKVNHFYQPTTLYKSLKETKLKITPTCFGLYAIHHQGVQSYT